MKILALSLLVTFSATACAKERVIVTKRYGPPKTVALNPCLNPSEQFADVVTQTTFENKKARFTSTATVTNVPEGQLTAKHVLLGISSDYQLHPTMDVASRLTQPVNRTQLRKGERITLVGIPAKCDQPSVRLGRVYHQRKDNAFIILFDEGQPPVFEGMSGGAALNDAGEVVGIIITQNYPLDLDRDGKLEHSADIIELASIGLKPLDTTLNDN